MKNTRTLFSLLIGLLLVALLTGCSTKEQAPPGPKFDESIAIDLTWGYEMNLIDAVKNADPGKFVTDLEKQWMDEYLAKKKAGEKVSVGWMTSGSAIKVTKVTATEAEAQLQWEDEGKVKSVTFKFKPVNGEWKIANHTTPDGKWWAPAKK